MKIKNKKWKNLLLSSAVAFGLLLLFEIIPGYMDIFSLSYGLISRHLKISGSSDIESSMLAAQTENKSLKITLGRMTSLKERSGKFARLLMKLERAAKTSRASIQSLKPLNVVEKDKLLIQPVELKVSAGYEGIYNFIRYLENSSNVFVIKEAIIKNSKKPEEKPEASLIIDFYLNL
ncbi:MAG TPA: type 4a pilus biogenesis protein PilO [Ignavibacteriales bacterium]|nr:type 4a pilus biogenesis protein PilO [Ignavibacteriales bacterium]